LEKRYSGIMNKSAINLLKGMLVLDANKRLSAIECLAHEYFDSIREQKIEQLIREQKIKTSKGIILNISSSSSGEEIIKHLGGKPSKPLKYV